MVATDQSLADNSIDSDKANSSIHTSSQQLKHINENFTPSFHQSLRQISSSQVLQLLAHERSWLAALEVTKGNLGFRGLLSGIWDSMMGIKVFI